MNKLLPALVLCIVLAALAFAAKPDFQAASVSNPVTGETKNTVNVPATAVQVSPSLFFLGTARDPSGRIVEGYAFIDRRKNFAKPGTECGNGVCEAGENVNKCPADCGGDGGGSSSCYGFLARGARWKAVEPYVMNADNTEGLSEGFLASNFAVDVDKWEAAAGKDILGDGTVTGDPLVADTASPDDVNEVYFGDVDSAGAIAITIVWGIFGGPPANRELIEWDMVFDQVDFDWSDSGEGGKMDFENIATHELGHSVGLDDLYTLACSEETMYGYADNGETKKRSLEAGDVTGIVKLYS